MRRDAALLAACVAVLLTVFTGAPARAGTYAVVSCGSGATENLAWAFESSAPRRVRRRLRAARLLAAVRGLARDADRSGHRALWGLRRLDLPRPRGHARARRADLAPHGDGGRRRRQRLERDRACRRRADRGRDLPRQLPQGPGRVRPRLLGELRGRGADRPVGRRVRKRPVHHRQRDRQLRRGRSPRRARDGGGSGRARARDRRRAWCARARSPWRRPTARASARCGRVVDGVERVSLAPACDSRLAAPCPARADGSLGTLAEGRHTVVVQRRGRRGQSRAGRAHGRRRRDAAGVGPHHGPWPHDHRGRLRRALGGRRRNAGGAQRALGGVHGPADRGAWTAGWWRRSRGRCPPRGSASGWSRPTARATRWRASVSSMSLSTRVGARARTVRNARAAVPYGRAVTVSGRLTTLDGAPLGGREVSVTSQIRQTGATPVALHVGPHRSSWAVLARRPGRAESPVARGVRRRRRCRSGSRAASRCGSPRARRSTRPRACCAARERVRFSGRLRTLGTKLPPGGKIVDLQAAQGGRWSTVDTTRASGRGGAWRAVARFRGTPGRYPVRLRIRREAAFGYDLGYSRAVMVTVR